VKKQGRKYEVELDWYYISKESLARFFGALVIVAAAVVGVVYYVTHQGAPDEGKRAEKEIAAAEDLLDKGKALPGASKFKEEIDATTARIAAARTALESKRFTEAITAAVEAQSIARRINGPTAGDALIVDLDGRVEVQRANRSTWETAKNSMKLFEGDFIKTGANGSVELMAADGTLLKIKPESLLEIHKSGNRPGSEGGQSEVRLISGVVGASTGEGSNSVIKTDSATAKVESRSNVGIDVDSQKNVGVGVYKGGATIESTNGTKIVLTDLEKINVAAGGAVGPKTKIPQTPGPVKPDDNAVFDLARKEPITLKWGSVKEATRYHLQIARSRLFIPDSIIVDSSDRTSPEVTLEVNDEGSFFWRVAALGKANLASEWSPYRRFRLETAGTPRSGAKTTPPNLVVQRPLAIGDLVTVQGKTDPGSSVTVNGETAEVDGSGVFKKIITVPKEGINTIIVRAVDGAGNATVRRENVLIQIY